MTVPDWHAEGNCNDSRVDPNDFAAEDFTGREHVVRETIALAICHGCPVIDRCLEWGMTREQWGIWGGLTARERRSLRRDLALNVAQVYGGDRRHPDRAAKGKSANGNGDGKLGVLAETVGVRVGVGYQESEQELDYFAVAFPKLSMKNSRRD